MELYKVITYHWKATFLNFHVMCSKITNSCVTRSYKASKSPCSKNRGDLCLIFPFQQPQKGIKKLQIVLKSQSPQVKSSRNFKHANLPTLIEAMTILVKMAMLGQAQIPFFHMQIAQNGRGLPPIYQKTKKYLKGMNFHGTSKNQAATPNQKKLQCFEYEKIKIFDRFQDKNRF